MPPRPEAPRGWQGRCRRLVRSLDGANDELVADNARRCGECESGDRGVVGGRRCIDDGVDKRLLVKVVVERLRIGSALRERHGTTCRRSGMPGKPLTQAHLHFAQSTKQECTTRIHGRLFGLGTKQRRNWGRVGWGNFFSTNQ
jgi:hypothetical protein